MALCKTSALQDDYTFEPLGTFDLFANNDDESYCEQDDSKDELTYQPSTERDDDASSDSRCPPSYLMKAILAGLYELPPPHILQYQNGWGRRIRYRSVQRLEPLFSKSPARTTCLERMPLKRYSDFDENGRATTANEVEIYRARIDQPDELNNALARRALLDEQGQAGLDVSNAGGAYHGQPNFFEGTGSCQKELYRKVRSVVESIQALHSLHGVSAAQELALEPDDIECWINVSRDGSWNRLHTHEGSAWSGVYYVRTPETEGYGGRLVLKPTPHPSEDTYQLNSSERARLCRQSCEEYVWVDETTYLDIDPVPGTMIVFPSYMHHCVLPSSMSEGDPPRISIAFNVNWKKC